MKTRLWPPARGSSAPLFPLAVAGFPLRNRPGLCFGCPLGDLSFPTGARCLAFDGGCRLGLAFAALKSTLL